MTTGFPLELIRAIEQKQVDAVLHFSRRSAENFVIGTRTAGLVTPALAPKQLCLSAQVAEPLTAAGARDVAIARRPDEASLLALLSP
jgi:uroporphyrinogen-III synthase